MTSRAVTTGAYLTGLFQKYKIEVPAAPWQKSTGFFPNPVYLKREDLIPGNLTGGGKLRKLHGLSAWLAHHQTTPDRITAWGSRKSNFLLELALWNAARKKPGKLCLYTLDRRRAAQEKAAGNSEEEKSWLEALGFTTTPLAAEAYASLHRRNLGDGDLVLPESGLHPGCLWGAFAAGADFYQGIVEYGINEVYTDAGWGISAAGLYYFLRACGFSTKIKVVAMTNLEDVAGIFKKTRRYYAYTLSSLGRQTGDDRLVQAARNIWEAAPVPELLVPATARSFGSINARVAAAVREAALELGIVAEPVYTAKLLLTAREHWAAAGHNQGRAVVLSGGPLGAQGFHRKLSLYVNT